jgi:hypothetical protein
VRKLKLSVEALEVESFHAEQPAPGHGTVAGLSATDDPTDCPATLWATCKVDCSLYYTQCGTCEGVTCGYTCATCGWSCADTRCGCPSNLLTECACQTWETCPGEMCS